MGKMVGIKTSGKGKVLLNGVKGSICVITHTNGNYTLSTK